MEPRLRHLANSAGTLVHPDARFDMVRCGIAVYRLSPGPAVGTSASLGLIPAMQVTAKVALVKRVPGVTASLRPSLPHASFDPARVDPVGYADGVPSPAPPDSASIHPGVRYSVSGTVAMDQIVVDIGDAKVRAGDDVQLFGPGSHGEPTADEWATACGTINYEIVTRLGPRLPRRHLGGAA